MNLPNRLTLLRVLMIPIFAVIAAFPSFWTQFAAAWVFGLACLTDLLDGHIARTRNLVTNFGKFVDPIADKLLVMSAFVVLVGDGRMPAWVCILLLAREFAISGFRLVCADGGKVIAAGLLGKIKTVTQMVAVLMLLVLVPLRGAPLLGRFGVVLSQIAMYVSLFFTIWSGADYIAKNYAFIREK
ncbi:MAG: CDP-diacylglycerol--glycerol-3-phosphate 3-phosphatidyltransferase [Clostridiales bacterium]|nr:CDP-diacylglycerol--glycerol-3-phosphate 3-phosphatidyltransferase [Clostridiales bacterium]